MKSSKQPGCIALLIGWIVTSAFAAFCIVALIGGFDYAMAHKDLWWHGTWQDIISLVSLSLFSGFIILGMMGAFDHYHEREES